MPTTSLSLPCPPQRWPRAPRSRARAQRSRSALATALTGTSRLARPASPSAPSGRSWVSRARQLGAGGDINPASRSWRWLTHHAGIQSTCTPISAAPAPCLPRSLEPHPPALARPSHAADQRSKRPCTQRAEYRRQANLAANNGRRRSLPSPWLAGACMRACCACRCRRPCLQHLPCRAQAATLPSTDVACRPRSCRC
jgi:hypothetical protein